MIASKNGGISKNHSKSSDILIIICLKTPVFSPPFQNRIFISEFARGGKIQNCWPFNEELAGLEKATDFPATVVRHFAKMAKLVVMMMMSRSRNFLNELLCKRLGWQTHRIIFGNFSIFIDLFDLISGLAPTKSQNFSAPLPEINSPGRFNPF